MQFQDIEDECRARGLSTQLAYSLWQFYRAKNPSKLATIPEIIEEWDGAEEDLIEALYQKYSAQEAGQERVMLDDIINGEVNGRGYGEARVDRVAAEMEGRETGEAVVEQIKRNAKKRVEERLTSGSPLVLPEALDLPPSPPPRLGSQPSPTRPQQQEFRQNVPASPPTTRQPELRPPQLGSQPMPNATPRARYQATPRKVHRAAPTPTPSMQSTIPTPTPTPLNYFTPATNAAVHRPSAHGVPASAPPATDLDRSLQELEEAFDNLTGKPKPPPQPQSRQQQTAPQQLHTLDELERLVSNLEKPRAARYHNLPIVETGPAYVPKQPQPQAQPQPQQPYQGVSAEEKYLALRVELEQYQHKVHTMLGVPDAPQPHRPADNPPMVLEYQHVPTVSTSVPSAPIAAPIPIPSFSAEHNQPVVPPPPAATTVTSFAPRGNARVWWVTPSGASPLPDFRCTFYSSKVYIIETGGYGSEEVWLWIGRNASQADSNAGFSEACTRSDTKGVATPLHRVFSEAEGKRFAEMFPLSIVVNQPLSAGVHLLQVNTVGVSAVQLCEAPLCVEATNDGVPCLLVDEGDVGLVCGDEGRGLCEAIMREFSRLYKMTVFTPQMHRLMQGTQAQRQQLDARLVARLGLSLKAPSRMVRVAHMAQNSFTFHEVPFSETSLHPSCVLLVFHQRTVTIWSGASIPLGPLARGLHISTVDGYIAENNLPPDMPISLVIQGYEPSTFSEIFLAH